MAETLQPRQTPTAAYPASARRPARANLGVTSCLGLLIASMLAIILTVVLAGVVFGRVGSWLDFHPFGLFAEPETTIDDRQPAVVLQMQSLARLETMNYTIEKVIEAEKGGNAVQDLLFGDRILLIAHGNVIAGVDLGTLDAEDVEVSDDNAVTVRLPASEIFVATLDNDQTRVYDRERGWLSRGDAEIETEARQAAETSILQAACDQGILDQAATEAKTQIEALLRALAFEAVTVDAPTGSCPVEEESSPD
jgi:hypothetical protein